MRKKRVIQVLPTLSFGDGVGNDTLAIHEILKRNGYKTHIYAETIGKRIPKDAASKISDMPKLKKDDVIIYHLAIGTRLNEMLDEFNGKKVIVYHNVTPPEFFEEYSLDHVRGCEEGQRGVNLLSTVADYCLADSEFNKQDLILAGYDCKIDVLPIIIPFSDYEKKPSQKVLKKYAGDDYTNILFTGRIVPNKKQEDVIRAFYHYQKNYNPKSRLFLVGSYNGMEIYYDRLKTYVEKLGVENVIFTGHIGFDEILAYYNLADLFLCMSEHEGFCIPLVEAMFFQIPIVAYQGTGVTGTLNGAGLPVYEKNPLETAGLMNYLLKNTEIQRQVIENQNKRLANFQTEKIEKQFLEYLNNFMD